MDRRCIKTRRWNEAGGTRRALRAKMVENKYTAHHTTSHHHTATASFFLIFRSIYNDHIRASPPPVFSIFSPPSIFPCFHPFSTVAPCHQTGAEKRLRSISVFVLLHYLAPAIALFPTLLVFRASVLHSRFPPGLKHSLNISATLQRKRCLNLNFGSISMIERGSAYLVYPDQIVSRCQGR